MTVTAQYKQAPIRFPIPEPYTHPSMYTNTGLITTTTQRIDQHVLRKDTDVTAALEAMASQPPQYEMRKTAAEADKELKDLFSGAIEDGIKEVLPEEAIVDDFVDGIVLKPHQVCIHNLEHTMTFLSNSLFLGQGESMDERKGVRKGRRRISL